MPKPLNVVFFAQIFKYNFSPQKFYDKPSDL